MVTKSGTTTDNLERAIALQTAPAWMPVPGDRLTGTLESVRKQDGREYGPYPVFVFNTPNGFTAVHAFHQTLIDGLRDAKAKIGDTLTLAYIDQRPTNASKGLAKDDPKYISYHLYVVIQGDDSDTLATEEYDWMADAPEPEQK